VVKDGLWELGKFKGTPSLDTSKVRASNMIILTLVNI
jgi:hypothetical protein